MVADLHQDEEIRIPNERHAGIVIWQNKILLLHRIRKNYEYFVVPGGHRHQGESPEDTVVREVEEETAIRVKNPRLVFEFRDYRKDNFDFYYLCEHLSGEEPKLNGEEITRNTPTNFFEPKWVDLQEIKSLNILPKFAKEWLEENLEGLWIK